MPLSPPHLLLLSKRVGDMYNQGRVLIVGGHYSLRHITKNRNLEKKLRQRSGYTEGGMQAIKPVPWPDLLAHLYELGHNQENF